MPKIEPRAIPDDYYSFNLRDLGQWGDQEAGAYPNFCTEYREDTR